MKNKIGRRYLVLAVFFVIVFIAVGALAATEKDRAEILKKQKEIEAILGPEPMDPDLQMEGNEFVPAADPIPDPGTQEEIDSFVMPEPVPEPGTVLDEGPLTESSDTDVESAEMPFGSEEGEEFIEMDQGKSGENPKSENR